MLHPQYFRTGAVLELPELSGHVADGGLKFAILGVRAGGMGVCVQLKQVGTEAHYALKCVRPDLIGDRSSLERFHDELEVWLSASMCTLVVEAITVVRLNEVPCVLSAWMEKGDLARRLPHMSREHRFETLVRTVRGLSWVHDNLTIIHRDLKPANILLDEKDLAFIADWGLARPIRNAMSTVETLLSDRVVQRPDRTQAGSFIGTVTYAAPEQILGAQDLDHRADIYALGCMMFECETGAPPFKGRTVAEIARQHIHAAPPQMAGWLRRTELGLERVVAKCLRKHPAERYQSYTELEKDLVEIARRRGFSLSRCVVAKRYERPQLGRGHSRQGRLMESASVAGANRYALVEFKEIAPFLEEAHNLMGLGRYEEAEQLLRPHMVLECLNAESTWLLPHSLALNLALCLSRIDGRLAESLTILERLNPIAAKPAEFYINFSLALLKAQRWQEAKRICQTGLLSFQEDLDIIGNHTIALRHCGDLDAAHESALKRITLRRDVHSIEEAVSVLLAEARAKRDIALPDAISVAKTAGKLITEGLSLNPRFYSLQIAHVQLYRFAHDEAGVVSLCQSLIQSDHCPIGLRQLAFVEMVEQLAEGQSYKVGLDLLQRSGPELSPRLLHLEMRILARRFMIGKEDTDGKRILTSVDTQNRP